mmetsp:Transcript_43460/g.113133  ORF Transcript_43460/g.113133 Transcript_43460/m.113133 type:complete len:173 (-) Transcript_43460:306-824(-)
MIDNDGWTAMHMAALTSQATIADYLIEKNCSLTRRASNGQSPIDIAWEQNADFREGNSEAREVWILVKKACEKRGIGLDYIYNRAKLEEVRREKARKEDEMATAERNMRGEGRASDGNASDEEGEDSDNDRYSDDGNKIDSDLHMSDLKVNREEGKVDYAEKTYQRHQFDVE